MHGQFDKPAKTEKPANSASHQTAVRLLILSIFVLTTVIVLAFIQPVTSNWIAEAVQAEFGGDQMLQPGRSPAQLAEPAVPRAQTALRGQR